MSGFNPFDPHAASAPQAELNVSNGVSAAGNAATQ
jgi:hypothetical protein